ncbi:class F sortase [Knoellia locipacati]|uniref:class F sortase n=1 Tax=Knoellia locipacati TaxID=882824 RepID=UPI00384C773E
MRVTTSSGVGRAAIVTVVALLAGVLGFAGYAAFSPPRLTDPVEVTAALEPSSSAGSSRTTPPATPSPPGSPTASSAQDRPVVRPAVPSRTPAAPAPEQDAGADRFRVEIPSLDVVLPVVPVGVAADGQMALPKDPDIGGWYRFGPEPTAAAGASVISAHVDSRDEVGPLAKLPRLKKGATIVVTVGGARVKYVVERVDQYAKTALDTDALFSRSGPARLHLVSCGGEWNPRTRHYEDNVVAIARRATVTDGVAYREPGGE